MRSRMPPMRWAALVVAIACAPPQESLPDAATPDAAAPDAEVSDASIDAGITPTLGETYRDGELIARYDRSIWAALPADEIVYGFFDPARFADYPDDQSLIFTADPSFDP